MRRPALLACAWLLMPLSAVAQTLAAGTLDLSVPDSPAFAVLNLNPQDVIRPATPTALVTNLLNGVDKAGNFQTGFALDTAPYVLWKGQSVTLQQYQTSMATRFVSRVQTSAAVVRGATEDDKSARLGLGVNFTVFDLDDARMDGQFLKELAAAGGTALTRVPQPPPGATPAVMEAYELELAQLTSSLARQARETRRRTAWNPTALVIGAAGAWRSEEGQVQDLNRDGAGIWASFGYGFRTVPGLEDSAHLILHGRWRSDVNEPIAAATAASAQAPEKWLTGVRLQVGGKNGTLSFEGSSLKPQGSAQTASRFSLAVERRVLDGTWLQLSFGGQNNPAGGSDTFVLSQLKWSLVER